MYIHLHDEWYKLGDVSFKLPSKSVHETLYNHHYRVLEGSITLFVPEINDKLDDVISIRLDMYSDYLKGERLSFIDLVQNGRVTIIKLTKHYDKLL